mmetsp:Transcript_27630/g.40770  ORF Transcript_27630/g.40770 Transcript_27630/m.40770 type:complete len:86 (+) Transcript_27630:577-834(+)
MFDGKECKEFQHGTLLHPPLRQYHLEYNSPCSSHFTQNDVVFTCTVGISRTTSSDQIWIDNLHADRTAGTLTALPGSSPSPYHSY